MTPRKHSANPSRARGSKKADRQIGFLLTLSINHARRRRDTLLPCSRGGIVASGQVRVNALLTFLSILTQHRTDCGWSQHAVFTFYFVIFIFYCLPWLRT